MLAALFVLLFLGGSSTGVLDFLADTKESVRIVVIDEERRGAALDTVKAMKKRTTAHNKDINGLIKHLKKDLREHGTQESDIDVLWEQRFDLMGDYSREMLDLRFQLKDQLTCEEWAQVFPGANTTGMPK